MLTLECPANVCQYVLLNEAKDVHMEGKYQPKFSPINELEFHGSVERVRRLRQAYLEGRLKVNSERLANKLVSFERQISPSLPCEKES